MADCSKTEVFLAEWKRICKRYPGAKCFKCPVYAYCKSPEETDATMISVVQKWSDEHTEPKPKTYADVFYEAFPNAVKRGEQYGNLPMTCRDDIFGTGCPIHGCCSASFEEENRKCAACWNEPYPEQEG